MIYPGERFTNPSGEGGIEFKRLFDGQGPLSTKDVEAFGNEPKPMMGETIAPWFGKEIEKRFWPSAPLYACAKKMSMSAQRKK